MRLSAAQALLLLVSLVWPLAGWAQVRGQAIPVSSGTGFFVSYAGQILTNNHVVKGCSEVILQGSFTRRQVAKVVATDSEHDLALLQTDLRARRIATLRSLDNSQLRIDEPVLVMGYPAEAVVTGKYSLAEAKVIGLKGPLDEPEWIQFSNAARHGNSGGPLLDSSGNVAGVITGRSTVFTETGLGQRKVISESDVAISLPIVVQFLDDHSVNYRTNGSYSYLMPRRIEELAKDYIVNILCPKKS